jgi:hypothetical protein
VSWFMLTVPELERLRQKHCDLEASLDCRWTPCLNLKKKFCTIFIIMNIVLQKKKNLLAIVSVLLLFQPCRLVWGPGKLLFLCCPHEPGRDSHSPCGPAFWTQTCAQNMPCLRFQNVPSIPCSCTHGLNLICEFLAFSNFYTKKTYLKDHQRSI